ncbi:MAG: hypothetical protein JF607_01185 [Burkholderiales bacterium]|nr:hypothetical protein [Burkholderiales bacterium]
MGAVRDKQIAAATAEALLTFSADQVATISANELLDLQRLLRHGGELGVWVTPPAWLTPGSQECLVNVDLRSRIRNFLSTETLERLDAATLEETVLHLSRYLVLLRIAPSGLGRASFRSLSPSSVQNLAFNYVPNLFALGLTKRVQHAQVTSSSENNSSHFLSLVKTSDLAALSASAASYVRRECERMRMLADLGLWHDCPSLEGPSLAEAMSGPKPAPNIPPSRDPHRPLPDDYVAKLGTRTMWVIKDLAPNILELAKKLGDVWDDTGAGDFAPVTVRDYRRDAVKDLLAGHIWKTSDGQPFGRPPFPLGLPKPKGFGAVAAAEVDGEAQADEDAAQVRWPPKTYMDFAHLLGTLQAAHLVVALLSIGPRRSEILSLPMDCVAYARDGRPYAQGRTFKLVERHDGEERDWQLPELAVEAIEQQVRLVRLSEKVGFLTPRPPLPREKVSASLWRRLSANQAQCNPCLTLRDINKVLVRYARTLGLDINPGGQRLRSHRFRKTLARLVALALTQAPRLLMAVFGHKSLEMTLYYILTDKELRAEIETVSRELRVMRAKEVVDAMVDADLAAVSGDGIDFGGYGGVAATTIHVAVVNKRQEVHRTGATWGAKNAIELAELLTLQGTVWLQVRAGVMCTMIPGETGPCNRSKGRPEPGKCNTSCGHRLEEAFLREDVEATLAAAVAGYESAIAAEDDMTAAHWAGQVRANLPRFPSVQREWATHPTVQMLVAAEAQA